MTRFACLTGAASLSILILLSGCTRGRAPIVVGGSATAPQRPGPVELTSGGVVVNPADTSIPLRVRPDLFNQRLPVVVGWAPDPEFPQRNLRIFARTMTPRALATPRSPARPGSATFSLGWESSGSPSQVRIYRQTWALGAVNTREFTPGEPEPVAELGALANGFHTWIDTAPALNTRNCYYIRAGDGTYWSYSNTDCAYSPNPDNPHPVGKVAIRLRLSTAGAARTGSNVRVRLNYGIPGHAPIYTWLDATDTPFFSPGAEATFMLRPDGIGDLSDITMIAVQVPGNDGLCLQELELLVDDATAFRKTSPTQQCGNGAPFDWALHSGYIDGTSAEIPFEELRNSAIWRGFNPPPVAGNPRGATFVGYTRSEFIRRIDGIMAHSLKEDGTDTGSSTRQMRNGNNDRTSLTRLSDREVLVQQHVRVADGSVCSVDAHPRYKLIIRPFDANGNPFTGSGNIASTQIVSELVSAGIDQNGPCQFIPGVNVFIQLEAIGQFGAQFRAIGATAVAAPPPGTRFCFPGPGAVALFPGFENGGLTICGGVD
jgi:hypothetical protein